MSGRLEWWETALIFGVTPVALFAIVAATVLYATRRRPPQTIPVLGEPTSTTPKPPRAHLPDDGASAAGDGGDADEPS